VCGGESSTKKRFFWAEAITPKEGISEARRQNQTPTRQRFDLDFVGAVTAQDFGQATDDRTLLLVRCLGFA
jgi:hypothetical protein